MNITDMLRPVASVLSDIADLYEPQDDLESTITALAMKTVVIAASLLIVLTVIAVLFSEKFPILKMPLFILMAIAMAGSTFTLIGSTIYLNTNSESGGPIHWHADIEFWACGNELELRDPTGTLSNKTGTAVLHEHNDHRIHLEGVVVEKEVDASLGKFMYVAGGAITDEALVVPLNAEGNIFEEEVDGDGPSDDYKELVEPYIVDDAEYSKVASFRDGDTCGDQVSEVQTFVYRYNGENKTYEQSKIENPQDFVIYEDPNVPPGDCIIFEFGPEREKTDKLCEQYGVRDIERCEQFGVTGKRKAICELTQTNYDPALDYEVLDQKLDETVVQHNDPANPGTGDPLNDHPCKPYFDSYGNPTGVEIARYDADGKLIDPATDCGAYVETLPADDSDNEEEIQ